MDPKVIAHELHKLTKRPARTQAEKEFHKWLLVWKKKLEVVVCPPKKT